MKKKTTKVPTPFPLFESGQIWQMGDTTLEMGLVGKRLVHYKLYKAQAKRPPTQLLGKEALEKFLIERGAILVPAVPVPAPAAPAARKPAPPRRTAATRSVTTKAN
jgi:hypothetical protein